MVSEIKKNLTIQPNPGLSDLFSPETRTDNPPTKNDKAGISNTSTSFATEAKGTLDMQATIRRLTVEQDLDQPDMAAKAYQHNQTDLEFLKDKK
jgi:hypothetical protein